MHINEVLTDHLKKEAQLFPVIIFIVDWKLFVIPSTLTQCLCQLTRNNFWKNTCESILFKFSNKWKQQSATQNDVIFLKWLKNI